MNWKERIANVLVGKREESVQQDLFSGLVIKPNVTEELKGEVTQNKSLFSKDLGEEHPFDLKMVEKWFEDDPLVHGAISKYVDFVLGPGFFVDSKDPRVIEILEDWMKSTGFVNKLYDFLKNGLVYGTGYLELSGKKNEVPQEIKVLDSKDMYIKRDNKGRIEQYNQKKHMNKPPVTFEPYEMSTYNFNRVGDSAYGQGLIRSSLFVLQKKALMINDMSLLMKRKANSPVVIKLGDEKNPPRSDVAASVGKDLEWMNNKHEWVFPYYTDIKALDFGSVGDKFTQPLDRLNQEILFGFQVPAVIMGMANVPEGLADAQLKAFRLNIISIQEELEKVIEEEIFGRILTSNGLNPQDAEIIWGKPTDEEKRKDIDVLLRVLDQNAKLTISDDMRKEIELKIADLLDIDLPETAGEEMEEPQPRAPPRKLQRPALPEPGKPEDDQPEEHLQCTCGDDNNLTEGFDDSLTLREFVGFDYSEYVEDIINFVRSKNFDKREWVGFKTVGPKSFVDVVQQYNLKDILSKSQLNTFKDILEDSFREGAGMNTIRSRIMREVKPGLLEVEVPAVVKPDGTVMRKAHKKFVTPQQRSTLMARTETIRASNQGALQNYSDHDINKVEWIAAVGERTCDFCDSQNGLIMSVSEANEQIPVHAGCRCSWAPVVQESFTRIKKKG